MKSNFNEINLIGIKNADGILISNAYLEQIFSVCQSVVDKNASSYTNSMYMNLWINVIKVCKDKSIQITQSSNSVAFDREMINQLVELGKKFHNKLLEMRENKEIPSRNKLGRESKTQKDIDFKHDALVEETLLCTYTAENSYKTTDVKRAMEFISEDQNLRFENNINGIPNVKNNPSLKKLKDEILKISKEDQFGLLNNIITEKKLKEIPIPNNISIKKDLVIYFTSLIKNISEEEYKIDDEGEDNNNIIISSKQYKALNKSCIETICSENTIKDKNIYKWKL